MPFLRNAPHRGPEASVRPQIQDMVTDNIAVLADKARHLEGVIPLWFGEGDMVTPAFIRDAAKRALDEGHTFYVPDMRGTANLTAALAAYQTRLHGRPIGRDRTTVTPGGMQAVALALSLLLETGDNAVYLTPQWPNIHNAIHVAGAEPRPCPLVLRDNRWGLDIDAVAARCDARTRAILFSSPNNPTGWTASADDLRALLHLARERGIWLVADEVYGRLYFKGDIAPSLLRIAEPDDLLLCVNSFSKAWAMTGFRLGWLTHPADLADRIGAMTQYLNSGTAAVIQEAGAAAITEGEHLVAALRERCRSGIAMAYERLSAATRVELPERPDGGMYVFFRVEGWPDARAACLELLERCRVGLAPGELFGDAAAGWFRMCICRDPAQLGTALDRLVSVLD
jgi:aspartate/methionine/tyrosine aminotransferase